MDALIDNSTPKNLLKKRSKRKMYVGRGKARMRILIKLSVEKRKQKKLAAQREAGLVAQKEITLLTDNNLVLKDQFEIKKIVENESETIIPDVSIIKPSIDKKLINHEQAKSNTAINKQKIDSDTDEDEIPISRLKSYSLNKQTEVVLTQHKDVQETPNAKRSSTSQTTVSKNDDAILPFSSSHTTQSCNKNTNQNPGASQTILNEHTDLFALPVVCSTVKNATTNQRAEVRVASTQVCIQTRTRGTQVNLYDLKSDQDDEVNCFADHYKKMKTIRSLLTNERRIIDLAYFFNELKIANNHGKKTGCNLSSMVIIDEKKAGLMSIYSLKCMMCNFEKDIRSEYYVGKTLNTDFVSAIVDIKSNFHAMNVLLKKLHLPTLDFNKYMIERKKISKEKTKEPTKNVRKKTKRDFYQKYFLSVPNENRKHKQVNLDNLIRKEKEKPYPHIITYQNSISFVPNEDKQFEEANSDTLIPQEQIEIKEDESEFILPDIPIMETSFDKMIFGSDDHVMLDSTKINHENYADLNHDEMVYFISNEVLNNESYIESEQFKTVLFQQSEVISDKSQSIIQQGQVNLQGTAIIQNMQDTNNSTKLEHNDEESIHIFDNRPFKKAKVVTYESRVGIAEKTFKQQFYAKDRMLELRDVVTTENRNETVLNREATSDSVMHSQQELFLSEKNKNFCRDVPRISSLEHSNIIKVTRVPTVSDVGLNTTPSFTYFPLLPTTNPKPTKLANNWPPLNTGPSRLIETKNMDNK